MTARTKPRILFVRNSRATFVEADLNSLRMSYPVTDCYFASRRINPFKLWHQVRHHDLVFGWFASWHSFLPLLFARLLGRSSVLIVGGYDVADMPEIGYGHQRGGVKKVVSSWCIRLATCLVTNAHYSRGEAANNTRVPRDSINVIYHGVEDVFRSEPQEIRERLALTVGNVDRPNLWRKGLEPFVRAAALLPDVQFMLVGAWLDDAIHHLRAIATPNVVFAGRVDDKTLRDCYARSSVYVQVSAHEGFGLSVAEAMLAGCIPVATSAGALPEIVGDAGLYADSQKAADVADVVREALEQPNAARLRARRRVLTRFPVAARQKGLEQIIEKLAARTTHA